MLADMDEGWGELARKQDGVVRAEEAVRFLGKAALHAKLGSGKWRRVHSRVIVVHNGPLSIAQVRWAALLHVGADGVLSHATAAQMAGLTGFASRDVHVLLPPGHRPAPAPGVVVHYTRNLTPDDLHPSSDPPRTRIERSVLDMVEKAVNKDQARALLASAIQQRLTTATRLRESTANRSRLRHRALVDATLDDIEGGSHSLPELRFLRAVRTAGLPEPDRQVVRRRPDGVRAYLDARWASARLTVEIDGFGHLAVENWISDARRQNTLVIDGERVLRFPSFLVREQPTVVTDQIRAALTTGPFPPGPRQNATRSRNS